jgi:hypothetical protein
VVVVYIVLRRGWRLIRAPFGKIDFWIECGSIAVVVLAAAIILAIRDYRAGVKKIRMREEEELWGKPYNDMATDHRGKD